MQNPKTFGEGHNFAESYVDFRWSKFIAMFTVLAVLAIAASRQAHADEGRIHVTFLKAAYGSGTGYLFFQDHKYALSVSSPKIRRVWVTTIDLIGTASNLRSAADIIGTYTPVDAQAATITRSKMARLENAKGTIVEIRAVNLNKLFSLDLTGMIIKNLGWQPSSE